MVDERDLSDIFEEAVATQVEQLKRVSQEVFEIVYVRREKEPGLDLMKTKEGELGHCINGALQIIMHAPYFGLDKAVTALDRYKDRMKSLEDDIPLSRAPSEIIVEIGRAVQTISPSTPPGP